MGMAQFNILEDAANEENKSGKDHSTIISFSLNNMLS
jgi:hypothetical protein